jgi:capsular exopolysaccharide synthesis family protein
MQQIVRGHGGGTGRFISSGETIATSPPLLEVLWRRRWTLGVTVGVCALIALTYLALGTKVYSASATVMIQQHAPRAYSENQGFNGYSETFLQTQADVFRSTSVLNKALELVNYRTMRTFAPVKGDPVEWLRRGSQLKIDVPRKSDTVMVSMESPYPEEAAEFVNCVVNAYVAEQSQQRQITGAQMIRALRSEKEGLLQQRAAMVDAMLKLKRENNVLSFRDDKTNPAMERVSALSASNTAAELAVMELRAQQNALRAAMKSPESISAYVTALESKGRDTGDKEYEELKRQFIQTTLALDSSSPMVGPRHPRTQVLQAALLSLKQRIAEKEREIAEAQLADVSSQLAVAEEKEKGLSLVFAGSEKRALELTPSAAQYARLEADTERLQKKVDAIDARIAEISVNNDAGLLNVQLLEPARAGERPVKPNKILVLGIALMLGSVLGIGLAMLRDVQDARVRRPEEIYTLLGLPVLAMIPRISARLSAVARGQMVRYDARSPVAEAYRAVRTALHLGQASKARTILVASPMDGDGKSMIAANLAIAFAHAGERTLVIDCDLREPVQHLIFEMEGRVGLSSVMCGEARVQEAICATAVAGLHVMPCGPVPVNPSELLTSKRFGELMRALSDTFDRIIIDSPSLMMFTDGQILAAGADVTLLVVRMNQSVRRIGTLALDALQKVGANVQGAIANDVAGMGRRMQKYGGAWQYASRGAHYLGSERGGGPAAALPAGKANGEKLKISEPAWSSDVSVAQK